MASPTDAASMQLRLTMLEKKLEALVKITTNLLKEYDAHHDRAGKCDQKAVNHEYSDGFSEAAAASK